jgi:regulator of protease activity HflC (stomatin/prohibitin superfamily)
MERNDFAISALIADPHLSPELRAALSHPDWFAFSARMDAREAARAEARRQQAERDAAQRAATAATRAASDAYWQAISDQMADEPLTREEVIAADLELRREDEEDDRRHGL